jgi:hypothetical protein
MRKADEYSNGENRAYSNKYTWRKSSRSYSDGQCVEVASPGRFVLVRDSKVAASPELKFDVQAWSSFIRDIKRQG